MIIMLLAGTVLTWEGTMLTRVAACLPLNALHKPDNQ